MTEKLFYIQHTECSVGNCLLFWGPNRGGYTCDLNRAGKYTLDEARRIVATRKPSEEIAWPVEHVDKLSHRHVSDLLHGPDGAPAMAGMVVGDEQK